MTLDSNRSSPPLEEVEAIANKCLEAVHPLTYQEQAILTRAYLALMTKAETVPESQRDSDLEALEEVEAIREALAWLERSRDSKSPSNAKVYATSLLAYIKQLEALQEGYYVDAQQARARVKQLEGERDEWEERYNDLLSEIGGVWPG